MWSRWLSKCLTDPVGFCRCRMCSSREGLRHVVFSRECSLADRFCELDMTSIAHRNISLTDPCHADNCWSDIIISGRHWWFLTDMRCCSDHLWLPKEPTWRMPDQLEETKRITHWPLWPIDQPYVRRLIECKRDGSLLRSSWRWIGLDNAKTYGEAQCASRKWSACCGVRNMKEAKGRRDKLWLTRTVVVTTRKEVDQY